MIPLRFYQRITFPKPITPYRTVTTHSNITTQHNPATALHRTLYRMTLRTGKQYAHAAQQQHKPTVDEIDKLLLYDSTLKQQVDILRKQMVVQNMDLSDSTNNTEPCTQCIELGTPCTIHNVDSPPEHYITYKLVQSIINTIFKNNTELNATQCFSLIKMMNQRYTMLTQFPCKTVTSTNTVIDNAFNVTIDIRTTPNGIYNTGNTQNKLHKFNYTVTITNNSTSRIQLLSREWTFVNEHGDMQTIAGAGVIGKQPVINSDRSFIYTSHMTMATQTGYMSGAFEFVDLGTDVHYSGKIQPTLLDYQQYYDIDDGETQNDSTDNKPQQDTTKHACDTAADQFSGSNIP